MNPKPNVTIIRPNLTPEERKERIAKIEKSMVNFWLALQEKRSSKYV